MINLRVVKAMGKNGNEPLCAEELAALVEGVNV